MKKQSQTKGTEQHRHMHKVFCRLWFRSCISVHVWVLWSPNYTLSQLCHSNYSFHLEQKNDTSQHGWHHTTAVKEPWRADVCPVVLSHSACTVSLCKGLNRVWSSSVLSHQPIKQQNARLTFLQLSGKRSPCFCFFSRQCILSPLQLNQTTSTEIKGGTWIFTGTLNLLWTCPSSSEKKSFVISNNTENSWIKPIWCM